MTTVLKKKLRQQAILRRKAIPPHEREPKDRAIRERLDRIPAIQQAISIMTYISCQGEVDTHALIRQWFAQEKQLFIPRLAPPSPQMEAVEIQDVDRDLRLGSFGILEPLATLPAVEDPTAIALHIVPGVLFTEQGERLGQGGGYYDRFLKRVAPKAPLIALAYEWQIVKALPQESWDIPIPMIITEERVIEATRS